MHQDDPGNWMVTVHLREHEGRGNNGEQETFFETEQDARLAVEWAYAVRLAEVRARPDATKIEERPIGEGSLNKWDRKLVWWQKVDDGYVCMKDYFSAEAPVAPPGLVRSDETHKGPRNVYMVLVNDFSGCVFVKDLDYFRSQGGFDWEKDPWGRSWFPVVATSIEDARRVGCRHPSAKPYEQQAK